MPKDPFKNILQQAKLRNQNVFNYAQSKSINENKAGKQIVKDKTIDKTPSISNQEGLDRAYKEKNYVFKNGNTLYIAGTQTKRDIYDDITKVPFNRVDKSQRYLDASQIIEKSILDNKPISNIVAHSLGGSVGLKLVDNYKEHPMTTTVYGAPVKTARDTLLSTTISGERYRHPYDPVSMFDGGAKTIPIQNNIINPHSYNGYGNKDIN
jgi:hypothetical protein